MTTARAVALQCCDEFGLPDCEDRRIFFDHILQNPYSHARLVYNYFFWLTDKYDSRCPNYPDLTLFPEESISAARRQAVEDHERNFITPYDGIRDDFHHFLLHYFRRSDMEMRENTNDDDDGDKPRGVLITGTREQIVHGMNRLFHITPRPADMHLPRDFQEVIPEIRRWRR